MKKLKGRALEKAIESAYYLLADRRQINIMKIGALFSMARERYTNCGETIEEATSAAIARFCEPVREAP